MPDPSLPDPSQPDPSLADLALADLALADLALADVVRWWRGLEPRAGGTRVLAVEGRSGCGKSSLAADLAALAPEAGTVAMDEVYPGWDGLADGARALARDLLVPLAAGGPAGVHRWDWPAAAPGRWRPVDPGPLLLVEGIGCGSLDAAPHLSGLIWVEAPADLRRRRALARDGATFAPHWDRWAAQEEAYLRRHRPRARADLVVDGACRIPGSPAVPLLDDRRGNHRVG